MSNSFEPDQARHFVRPGLGPNCLQWLSAADTRRQRVKGTISVKNNFYHLTQHFNDLKKQSIQSLYGLMF